MGKQINFYMDEETEINFIKFCLNEGFKFLYVNLKEKKVLVFKEFSEIPLSDKNIWSMYIYSDDFGDLVFTEYDAHRIDIIESPAIEFVRTTINFEKKQLNGGRLWLESKYYKDGQQVKKSDKLISSFNTMLKWIKKTISIKEIEVDGCIYKEYISDKLMIKVDEGYIPV